ncbi:regulator of G-protein signaling 5 [Denticeps clupeoides]|uniref:regulator of G-protein signaling 5 n=1 Tax=Denticeps clupeoides TaxID=299321 RepID=UPI0010A3F7DA|nr:regulator of G-protein signaling 5-like [Denticeps clupeoides]XP_028828358.1 regulator of G-protein signaling 5-like [Denticeps clupeoides]
MCKGLSHLPASCLEKAKGMRVKLSHLADKQDWTHKHKPQEETAIQDLESLLNNKMGLQAFRWFLRSEFSEENLEFWLACQEYRSTPRCMLGSKAESIYRQFINADAPQEVNLDAETRESLSVALERPGADAFARAQSSIYALMAKDSFPRFLRSQVRQEASRAS